MSTTVVNSREPKNYAIYILSVILTFAFVYPMNYVYFLLCEVIPSPFVAAFAVGLIMTSAYYLPATTALDDPAIAKDRRASLHKIARRIFVVGTIIATFALTGAAKSSYPTPDGFITGPALIAAAILIVTASIYGVPRKALQDGPREHIGALLNNERVIAAAALKKLPDESPDTPLGPTLTIGGLVIPPGDEPGHICMSGATGQGKTEIIYSFLRSIRMRRGRVVIFDNAGIFASKFYRPGVDLILNPGDQRTVNWSPFSELRTKADFARVAAAMVPDAKSTAGAEWVDFARKIISDTLKAMHKNKCRDVRVLYRLLEGTADQLAEYLISAGITGLADDKSRRMFSNAQSTYKAAIEYLDELPNDSNFSIRNWVEEGDGQDGWIFLTYRDDQMALMRPFVATMAALGMSAVRGLAPDPDRRIFFILDELSSVGAIPELEDAMTKGRKYGLCMLLSFQAIPQLNLLYGADKTKSIRANAGTVIALNPGNDEDSGKIIAATFGKMEIKSVNVSQSYNQSNSGMSSSASKGWSTSVSNDPRDVVSYSDLLQLRKGEAVVKLKSDTQPYLVRSALRSDLPDSQPAEVRKADTLLRPD